MWWRVPFSVPVIPVLCIDAMRAPEVFYMNQHSLLNWVIFAIVIGGLLSWAVILFYPFQ